MGSLGYTRFERDVGSDTDRDELVGTSLREGNALFVCGCVCWVWGAVQAEM